MQDSAFTEKLYTSTEVAQILGVSLRSIYRYLDENKIQAAVKTATGRHRFTKQNINDFLHPGSTQTERVTSRAIEEDDRTAVVTRQRTPFSEVKDTAVKEKTIEEEVVKEEPVDWLARFRQAAEKYKTQEPTAEEISEPVGEITHRAPSRVAPTPVVKEPEPEPEVVLEESMAFSYYRSGVGGLKEIAQSLDKAAKNASLDYAFTMNAGLSLHKPIKPFSIIHSYVRPQDLGYFEKVLQLSPSQKDTAQLCLIPSSEQKLYDQRREMHGLYVVSDSQIKLDLLNEGETDLANELE